MFKSEFREMLVMLLVIYLVGLPVTYLVMVIRCIYFEYRQEEDPFIDASNTWDTIVQIMIWPITLLAVFALVINGSPEKIGKLVGGWLRKKLRGGE